MPPGPTSTLSKATTLQPLQIARKITMTPNAITRSSRRCSPMSIVEPQQLEQTSPKQQQQTKTQTQTQTQTPRRTRRVCLFGTSANPPTGNGGHIGLVRALVNLKRYDEVRILPVYRHTFSSKRDQLVAFSHRVAMCELAVSGLGSESKPQPNGDAHDDGNDNDTGDAIPSGSERAKTRVTVSRAEEESFQRMCWEGMTDEEKASLRVGTADLLEMLLLDKDVDMDEQQRDTEFSFCLGADTFLDLTDWKWKRSRDVLRLLGGRLVVVNRKQASESLATTATIAPSAEEQRLRERVDAINASDLGGGNIVLLDVPALDDVSSSRVRNLRDENYAKKVLSPKVFDYVVMHNLYGFGDGDTFDGDGNNNNNNNNNKNDGVLTVTTTKTTERILGQHGDQMCNGRPTRAE